ncbi:MAG: ATP-binding cassette domain-containing protein [Petrimonas sp.]|jgi:NitT/TauT family transport system ATP-binding protein
MKIEGLYFAYPNNNQIFSNFSFKSDSDFIILKGPSGCGKTTLLKLISSNLKPDKYRIFESPSKVSMILQEDALFPWMSGFDNIIKMIDVDKRVIYKHPMMDHVKHFIEKPAYEMSYGQRRLIELFRAILYKPTLLCLDEPFNYLDPISRGIITECINPYNATNKTKIIMSTHYNEKNLNFTSEVYYFDGKFPISVLTEKNVFNE